MNAMNAYRGFKNDLTCRHDYEDKQTYEVGKTYEAPDAELWTCGYHACEYPLDALTYYSPADSRYCQVELDDVSASVSYMDSIRCARRIKVEREIGLTGLAQAGIEYISEHGAQQLIPTDDYAAAANTANGCMVTTDGNCSAATSTGRWSAAIARGECSAAVALNHNNVATARNDYSASVATGGYSVAVSEGDLSMAASTGGGSAAIAEGRYSTSIATDVESAAIATGDYSASVATGCESAAKVTGRGSIAVATAARSKAAGALGCWLVLTERKSDGDILAVRAVQVDGETIKADTYYSLVGGKVVAVDD